MTCRFFHRWTRWTVEFEECPDGWMGVWEYRSRECKRKRCDMVEEVAKGCVSSSAVAGHGQIR